MSVRVLTQSTCDRCGESCVEEGAHGDTPPVTWGHLTLNVRAPGDGWSGGGERMEWTLCVPCVAKVKGLMNYSPLAEHLAGRATACAHPEQAVVVDDSQDSPF